MTPRELGRAIIDACLAQGFARAGIAPASPSAWGEQFRAWLASGGHAEMAYMHERVEQRLDVTRLLPGARAVIMVADQYAPRGDARSDAPADGEQILGVIARYARGRDYHRVIKDRLHQLADRLRALHPEARFRSFVDTGPVLEREQALRAGLGADAQGRHAMFLGKHTLAIDPRLGSYLLLGGIATTLDVCSPGPTLPSGPGVQDDRCGTCTRCIDACPTGAISPNRVDASRCVSYLTLEHASLVDPKLHAGIGDRLLGCDVCQDVCPYNVAPLDPAHDEHERVHPAYRDGAVRARVSVREVLDWTEDDRRRVLSASAGKRATLDMLRRTAVIIAGNALRERPDSDLRERLGNIASDSSESPVVRETARAVLEASRSGT